VILFRRIGRVSNIDEVLSVVCRTLNVKHEVLRTRLRNSHVRAIAAKALCDHCGLTQRQIGAKGGAKEEQKGQPLRGVWGQSPDIGIYP
jgi:hypothetical protein